MCVCLFRCAHVKSSDPPPQQNWVLDDVCGVKPGGASWSKRLAELWVKRRDEIPKRIIGQIEEFAIR